MRRALAASRVGCCESVAARRLFHLAREALAFRDMVFLTERGVCRSLSSGEAMRRGIPSATRGDGQCSYCDRSRRDARPSPAIQWRQWIAALGAKQTTHAMSRDGAASRTEPNWRRSAAFALSCHGKPLGFGRMVGKADFHSAAGTPESLMAQGFRGDFLGPGRQAPLPDLVRSPWLEQGTS